MTTDRKIQRVTFDPPRLLAGDLDEPLGDQIRQLAASEQTHLSLDPDGIGVLVTLRAQHRQPRPFTVPWGGIATIEWARAEPVSEPEPARKAK